ncbi:glycan-binding surface protein [Pollutibacter soli]|uniref:glycan-binding surface protein n=1 Tax=Pollutibacter soli TaxID=3034157 RepID=UPI003013FEC8
MKKFISIFSLTILAITGMMLASCEKEDSGGTPMIKYVRVTRPEASDSLLVGAGQGQLIAIMGDNLQDAVEIWFNDQASRLTPTYITKESILVSVPSQIPLDVTNKLKIIFKNGYELLYDFEVQISEPVVSGMESEFVNDGEVAIIRGDYFYAPLSVKFPGGGDGEIVAVTDQEIQVRVPAGSSSGQLEVTTNFGTTKSDFWFRDTRNSFINSDPYEGWWNSGYVVSNPGPGDPPKISGNYIRYKKFTAGWSWNELAGGPASAMPVHSKNIPDEAILKPANYNLKFEINTVKPYNANYIKINAALNAEDNDAYVWRPPFDSKGKWVTVTIPFEEVVASYKVKPVVNPNGYWSRILVHGPGDLDADFALDNLRIVPKVIE